MGYADITTTMNIYAEATKEKKQQAMANLNGKMHHLLTISGSSLKGTGVVLKKSVKIAKGLILYGMNLLRQMTGIMVIVLNNGIQELKICQNGWTSLVK